MEKSGWNRYGCHSYKYKGRESAAEGQTLVYKFSLFRYLHVWYSSNWYGWNMCCTLCSAQARKSERAIGRFIRDTSTSRAPHWFEIHNFWITILTFFCFEAILKSFILQYSLFIDLQPVSCWSHLFEDISVDWFWSLTEKTMAPHGQIYSMIHLVECCGWLP